MAPPPRQTSRLLLTVGRFSPVPHWPVLGVPRGLALHGRVPNVPPAALHWPIVRLFADDIMENAPTLSAAECCLERFPSRAARKISGGNALRSVWHGSRGSRKRPSLPSLSLTTLQGSSEKSPFPVGEPKVIEAQP